MRGGIGARGYTILEVMLFMTVSGLMFVMAAVMLSGKQARAEFHQGLDAANAQVQSISDEVLNGSFDSNNDFTCQALPSTLLPPQQSGASTEQGGNVGCIFAGKILEMNDNSSNYVIYTLAGRQYAPGTTDNVVASSFDQVKPTIFDHLSQNGTWKWGLQVKKVLSTSAHTPIHGVGFFNSFGTNTTTDGLAAGSQTIMVVPIINTVPANIDTELASITAAQQAALPNPNIEICFDGGKGMFATLTIGGDNSANSNNYGQRVATNVHVYNSLPSECT